jgi:putative addiction module component (TIGR02574 family)
MTSEATRVLEEALRLDVDERAKIAEELLASCDAGDEDIKDVEAAWAAEIMRRVADARANPEDSEDWRKVMADLDREFFSR